MDKIKILMVLNNPGRGGSQTYAMNVLRSIDRAKFQIDFVFSVDKNNSYKEEILSLGSKIHFIPEFKIFNYSTYSSKWYNLLRENKYDIVHGHVSSSAVIYLKIAKKCGCKTIVHSHSAGYRGNACLRAIKYIFTKGAKWYADYWFACSDKAARRLFGINYSEDSRYHLIPNAIDVKRFMFDEEKRTKIRSLHNITNDTLVCGHVGSFSTPKNHKYLLEIFKRILMEKPSSLLVLVGDGYLRESIVAQAKELNIYDKIILVGNVGNVNEYMMAMDVMIFPSLFEGFPVTVLEAQATGLSSLISDTITTEVDLTDLVKRLSIRDKCDCWIKSIRTTHLEERKKYNKIIAESKYSMENSIESLCNIYNGCL